MRVDLPGGGALFVDGFELVTVAAVRRAGERRWRWLAWSGSRPEANFRAMGQVWPVGLETAAAGIAPRSCSIRLVWQMKVVLGHRQTGLA
ncbi:MAG: hypothetical protein HS114_19295 [Anaerolineales bacterium]|nr:hypothetical protein [Anaerolineales bacterium]